MRTLHITERAGKDGILELRIPLGDPETEFDVVVIIQPRGSGRPPEKKPASEWPPGYFDLFGSITDDTFERPPQRELPPPIELD